MMTTEEINKRFNYHAPKDGTVVGYHEAIRSTCANAAHWIDQLVPDGREKALALTKIEEAMMWANAGIARNQS